MTTEDADGDGRRIPSVPIPHHTHILLARVRAPYSPPRLRNGSFAHASRSGGQRNFLELQALHPAQPPAPVLYSDCTLLYTGRSLDPRNITGAQRASSARSVSPLVCSSDCLPASPPYACSSSSHANRCTGQRNTTLSSTVLARPAGGRGAALFDALPACLVCWARYLVRPVKATRAWSHSATALRRLLHTPVFCAIWLTDGPRSSGKSHKKARGQSVIKVPRARARKHTHTKTDRLSSVC